VIFDILVTENGEILILATDGRIQIGIRDEHSQNANPLISFNFEFGSNGTMERDATSKHCLSRMSREEGIEIDSNSEQHTNKHSAIRFSLEVDSNHIVDSDSHGQNENCK
jgi:hypothetical protein